MDGSDVAGSSFAQNLQRAIGEQFTSDLVILGEGIGGLSPDLLDEVAGMPQVRTVSPLGNAPARVAGENVLGTTIEPTTIESVLDVDVREGSLGSMAPDQLAVAADFAERLGLDLGDAVPVEFPDGAVQPLTVAAIYATNALSTPVALPRDTYFGHTSQPADLNLMVELADGVAADEGEVAVQRVADEYGAPDVLTNDELSDRLAGEVVQLLAVAYVLLALSIIIALLGIANTVSLSIYERTRELGLLRAVGQTRAQLREMVHGESVIVALLGTVGGLGSGLLLGWAFVASLPSAGGTSVAVPLAGLVAILVGGALVGVLAAVGPARRASRLDVLSAITT